MSAPNPNGHTVQQVREIAGDLRRLHAAGVYPETLGTADPLRIDWLCDDHASLLEQVDKLRGALGQLVKSCEYEGESYPIIAPSSTSVAYARAILAENQEGGK